MVARWLVGIGIGLGVLGGAGGLEARPCDYLPIYCTFEGEPFTLTVVDAETRQPLADVHALAEWQLNGAHGRNGPLMVQDTVSGADGVLRFPRWGPLRGYRSGLAIGSDPIVTLFKPGYRGLVQNNRLFPPAGDTDRVRRFGQDGDTLPLEPFRGSAEAWAAELGRIWHAYASPISDADRRRFRQPYLNRLRRVWAERDTLPARFQARGEVLFRVRAMLDFLEEGQP